MRKKQSRSVIFAIISILLASILFLNNYHFQTLLAENNASSNNTTVSKTEPTTKPTPELTSNPANILESFMSPKALLASTIDQIRNSTARNDNSNNETSVARNVTIFVQNPGIILLSHQIIPPKDFIPVYDAMPYEIINGQVSAKLPCDSNSKPSLQILAGQFPELEPAELKLITTLSRPGYMCMYYANLGSTNNNTAVTTNATSNVHKVDSTVRSGVVTYIELFNPTEYRVVLPSTASLSISVNQIIPLEVRHHTNQNTGLNQTVPALNQTVPTTIENTPNHLTRLGISPTIAFVYNAWNPYLKQKTYLPIMPLVNETILSNSICTLHALWQSPKEEQSDLAELKEYSIITNKNGGNPPMFLHLCGGAPIP